MTTDPSQGVPHDPHRPAGPEFEVHDRMPSAEEPTMQSKVVDTLEQLDALLLEAKGVPEVSLDTEADGFYRYRAKVCIVQLYVTGQIYLVDTLRVPASALAPVVQGDATKIIHDAGFDARLLGEVGLSLSRVYDTAVAARFLGEKKTGLAALVRSRLGVGMDKSERLTDWGQRPLTEESLAYLIADVQHLGDLASALRAEVAAAGIEEEVREETQYVLDCAKKETPAEPPWTRIKGHGRFTPMQLSILRELALCRESRARNDDVPASRVLPDWLLVLLAQQPLRTAQELMQIVPSRQRTRFARSGMAETLFEAYRAGQARAELPPEEHKLTLRKVPDPAERARAKLLRKELSAWRDEEAKKRGVDAQVILPGHCLRDLVEQSPKERTQLVRVAGLGASRADRYGQALLQAVSRHPVLS